MRGRIALLLVVGALALPGCGRFASSSATRNATTTTAADVEVGTPDLTSTTTTSQPTADDGAGAAGDGPSRPKRTTTTTPPPANVRRSVDPSGFRFSIAVGGTLRYDADDEVTLQVEVGNTSSRPLDYDPNEYRTFLITPRSGQGSSWRNTDCGGRPPPDHPAQAMALEPGETVTFQAVYPVTRVPGSDSDGGRCRLPKGDYAAFAVIAWCPPGTKTAQGTCDPARNKLLSSTGVPITIG